MKCLVLLLLAYFSIHVDAIEYTQIALKVLDAYISEMLYSPGNETECENQLKIYLADIKSFKVWALRMLDSTAKMHAGILTGNIVQIGNYDECLEINVNRNGSQIKGQYCRSILSPSKTVNECINRNFAELQINAVGKTTLDEVKEYLKMQWHVCIPAACSVAELQSIWDFAEDRYELKFHLLFVDDLCSTVEKLNYYSPLHIAAMLAPSMAAIILVYVGILPHLGTGPYWNYVDALLIQPCVKHWWSTLLFIQNYLHPTEACVLQTWYLSVDTHLYLLSPLLFLPLQRWPKTTIVFIVGLILISIGSVIQATYYYEIDSISIKSAISFYEKIYNPTHMRVTPWLAGILLGYFMFKYRNKKMEIKKKYVLLLWAACIVVMFVILYGCIAFFNIKCTILMVALFNALSRPIWGACICWVIFACSRGYGGYINKFLSLSIFNILARLTFSIFTYLLIVSVVQGQRGTSAYVYNLFHFYEVWGDFAFTTAFSIIWTLTFESPITILEKVIIQKALEQNQKSNKISKRL